MTGASNTPPPAPPEAPVFTVVVATYERGALIEATLESVAAQTYPVYEVLVVSDGPPAKGLADSVKKFGSRFRLEQLEARTRSQSGPNNRGWDLARGQYVAYLGHDDVWESHHLERLAHAFATRPDASFAVSGCIYCGPPGATEEFTWVTGLFDSSDAAIPREHFFPPSSFAHRRDLTAAIERWPDAAVSSDPVDVALLKGAAAAGLRFASTGTVTVFKFASALRYLSYLYPDDSEQRQVLERMRDPAKLDAFVTQVIRGARRRGAFMSLRYSTSPGGEPGGILNRNEQNRGITPITPTPLEGPLWIAPGDDPRGTDWYSGESFRDNPTRWRWSGPSIRPRLRIPAIGGSPARFTVYIAAFASDRARDSLTVSVNESAVEFDLDYVRETDSYRLVFVAPLQPERESVVEFRMDESGNGINSTSPLAHNRQLGFCLVGLSLEQAAVAVDDRWPDVDRALVDRALLDRALLERDRATDALATILASRTWRYSAGIRSIRRRLHRRGAR